MSKVINRKEVSQHNSSSDAWIIIDEKVYDITKFARLHPGGEKLLLDYAGKDCTTVFWNLHRAESLKKYSKRLQIGVLPKDEYQENMIAKPRMDGELSMVPYAEASVCQGFRSPYWKQTHHDFRKAVRKFMDENVKPDAPLMDNNQTQPSLELYKKLGQGGILASRIGVACGSYFNSVTLPNGLEPEKFDYFHEQIAHEENSNYGCPSLSDGIGAGMVIGLPPVLHFAKKELKDRIVPEVLRGDKRICLAITEPFAGSDVANIKCTAKLSEDGTHYIVNGVKKWITNGTFCDYFTTAVRTGEKGIKGISLMLIERQPGLETKLIKTSYGGCAGTSYIIMENVKVPVENLLGKLNQGFRCIMYNFNHERWLICVAVIRASRTIIEECFKWAHQRKVFNKPLIAQPVIREKLGSMISEVEAVYNWLENITYQMNEMSYNEQSKKLAGPIALLKYRATRVALNIADEACQIFGGRAITKTGMGRNIESFQRAVKYSAILGGSEEIMADLGVRQAIKYYPRTARL